MIEKALNPNRTGLSLLFLNEERVRMKRVAGAIIVLMLGMFVISGCFNQECPHGVCTPEASPNPDKAAEAPAGEEAPAQ